MNDVSALDDLHASVLAFKCDRAFNLSMKYGTTCALMLLSSLCVACTTAVSPPVEEQQHASQSISLMQATNSQSSPGDGLMQQVEGDMHSEDQMNNVDASAVMEAPKPDIHEILIDALHNEYRSHARYQMAIDTLGEISPFPHVDEAEEERIRSLQGLLTKYGLPIPKNSYLGYMDPPERVLQACRKGLLGEEETARLYEQLLPAAAEYDDIHATFLRYARASRDSHVPAFKLCVEREMNE